MAISANSNSPNQHNQWEAIYKKGEQSSNTLWGFVAKFVEQFAPVKPIPDTHILEVGCGVGNNLITLAKQGFMTDGLDISQTAINIAIQRAEDAGVSKNCSWVQQSCVTLPYASGVFDMVIDRATLCYLSSQDQHKAINEIYRVLSPNGMFLFNPYLFFNQYDDGKKCYTLTEARCFLPEKKWHIEAVQRNDVGTVCGYYAIVARKV